MDRLKIERAHIHGYSMGGSITGRLLATHPERFITAAFGGSGITEADPDWIAKLPPDKQGTDPGEAALSHALRIHHAMDNGILHRIEDDLAESWVAEWAGSGVDAIEAYLAKHLAFLSFLDEPSA